MLHIKWPKKIIIYYYQSLFAISFHRDPFYSIKMMGILKQEENIQVGEETEPSLFLL